MKIPSLAFFLLLPLLLKTRTAFFPAILGSLLMTTGLYFLMVLILKLLRVSI